MQDTFISGYTKALLDVKDYISRHGYSIRKCRLFNEKGMLKLIDALIEHREEMRRTGDCLLVYNEKMKEFINDNERSS